MIFELNKFTNDKLYLVYDVTKEKSFNSIDDFVKKIKYKFLVIMGAKSDLDNRAISYEEGKKKADMYNAFFYETRIIDYNMPIFFEKMIDKIKVKKENKNRF